MEHGGEKHRVAPVLITLFKGVLYQDQNPDLWPTLLNRQARIRDHVRVFGLELMLDEAEGHAYLRQRPSGEDEEDLPRLVQRRQLGYSMSLLLALLRKRLTEHDASGDDTRLILSRQQIADLVQVFLPGGTNEAKLVNRLDADLNKVVELGFLRRLRGQQDQFEVRRLLKSFVDAQWLSEFDARLAEYRAYLDGSGANAPETP